MLKIIMLDENQTDIALMKPLFAECAQCLRLPRILCCSILIFKHSFAIIKGKNMKWYQILLEVGDINCFDDTKELQKLVGLAMVENSSAKHKDETTINL